MRRPQIFGACGPGQPASLGRTRLVARRGRAHFLGHDACDRDRVFQVSGQRNPAGRAFRAASRLPMPTVTAACRSWIVRANWTLRENDPSDPAKDRGALRRSCFGARWLRFGCRFKAFVDVGNTGPRETRLACALRKGLDRPPNSRRSRSASVPRSAFGELVGFMPSQEHNVSYVTGDLSARIGTRIETDRGSEPYAPAC
jgi:hypothetical protein